MGIVVVEEGEIGPSAIAPTFEPAEELVIDDSRILPIRGEEPVKDGIVPVESDGDARPGCGVPGEFQEDRRPKRSEMSQVPSSAAVANGVAPLKSVRCGVFGIWPMNSASSRCMPIPAPSS